MLTLKQAIDIANAFKNFFDMIVEGRRDYENMSQEILCVK